MIYDDVELGEEGGCSSLDNGWSSSEFESYDEASDGEGHPENGLPHAFMRGKPPQKKTHVCRSSPSSFSADKTADKPYSRSGFVLIIMSSEVHHPFRCKM